MATTPPSAQEVKRGARPGRKKGCPPGALKGVSGQDVKGASPPRALKGVSAQDVKRGFSFLSCDNVMDTSASETDAHLYKLMLTVYVSFINLSSMSLISAHAGAEAIQLAIAQKAWIIFFYM